MEYSDKCIDESKGFTKMPDGSLKPNELGRKVLSINDIEQMFRKVLCPYCSHDKAIMNNNINSPKDAYWICHKCGKRIR